MSKEGFWLKKKMTVETKTDDPRDQFPIGMRVLAVDDDPTCLLILESLLRRCQYHGLFLPSTIFLSFWSTCFCLLVLRFVLGDFVILFCNT